MPVELTEEKLRRLASHDHELAARAAEVTRSLVEAANVSLRTEIRRLASLRTTVESG